MKQIIQDLKDGKTILEEVPSPQVKSGNVLIKTSRSLVSLGTERMLVEFGKANLVEKARQQPDKVKQVLDKMKTDGIMPTLETVFNKLGQPLPLGYCNVGTVVGVGAGVKGFKVGDRVASNGNHAEYVNVPENLVATIPDNVSDEEATFTIIGAIGLQGIRLVNPTLGETVVVVGLGLIGLITCELLIANGCKVIGFDFDQTKVDLAKSKGVDAINPSGGTNQVDYVLSKTKNIGSDAVIITASAKSDEIISQAAQMSRKRGRIVLVGVVGLNISRADFFEKELTFQVSCSYGPGRYDDSYEQKGQDYPIGFVRWTEKRNFEAVLEAISSGKVKVESLITERVKLEDYQRIYGDMKKAGSIASILEYADGEQNTVVKLTEKSFKGSKAVFGIIGAGNYTSAMIVPKLKQLNASIKYIASSTGLSSTSLAKKAGIANATTDYFEILKDAEVDTVVITTRHNLHAKMVLEGIQHNKNVFVEKPLCLTHKELAEITKAIESSTGTITVGYNRRFAPLAQKLKSLTGASPMNIVATMNAGSIPPEVWVHDLEVGGGRLVGEACHYVDLCAFLADSEVEAVCVNALGTDPQKNTDDASILLKFKNGSNAVINYFANGSKAYPKERVEVHQSGDSFVLDNWRVLQAYGVKGFTKMKSKQNKGQKEMLDLLNDRIKNGGSPLIPIRSLINTTKATFAIIESLEAKGWVKL